MITTKLNSKRIFITEDNSSNRVVYTVMLKRSGAILDFDRFGRETISKLQGFHPDLIILDLMLPNGNNGFDLFREIRNVPELKTVPIVAISASDPSYAMQKCQELGFSGFIAKPVEDDLFVEQLSQLIDGESVWYIGSRYSK